MPFARCVSAQKVGAQLATLILLVWQVTGCLLVANAEESAGAIGYDLLTAGNLYASQPWVAGWSGGAELTLLRPFHTMGTTGVEGTDFSFGLRSAPRFWLGYGMANGLGIRARYWDFNHGVSGPSIIAGRTEMLAYNTYAVDLEVTSRVAIASQWDILVSGGGRYVNFEEKSQSTITATGALGHLHQFDFAGLGPTISMYASRPLFWNFGLFTNLRYSVLMGNEDEISTRYANDHELANIRTITELQLGAEWRRSFAGRGQWFIRASYEAQYWASFSGEEFYDGGESVGFGGVAFAVGLTR